VIERATVSPPVGVAGIALLGVVTASLASWFVERVGEVARAEQGVEIKLDTLVREIEALRAQVDQHQRNG
jgi:voltage-gated potassium channel